MSNQKKLEEQMNEYLVKKAPFQIPEGGRKAIVEWLPWISLVVGVLSLLAALSLWRSAHTVNQYIDATNDFLRAYGGDTVHTAPELGLFFYVALIVITIQGALALYAFPGLKARKKSTGWNILLLSSILNFFYGVFVAFTNYGSFGNIVGSVIGTLIGLYILAQISSYYNGGKAKESAPAKAKKATTKK